MSTRSRRELAAPPVAVVAVASPPCGFCHLGGEHGGRIRVRGRAPDQLTWWLGRDPILIVERRELKWSA